MGFDTAIVLAAGAGRRFASITPGPKCLLPLSGQAGDERFIDYHLRAVAKVGARSVVIVGNREVTRAPMRSILTLGPGVEVRFVEATVDPDAHGVAYSLSLALEHANDLIDGRRLLIGNANVVAGADVYARLKDADAMRSAILVAPGGRGGRTEVWVDPTRPQLVARLGRGLQGTPGAGGRTLRGMDAGMVSVASADVSALKSAVRWALQHTSGGTRARLDEALQLMAERGAFGVVDVADTDAFINVETPDDYAKLIADVWPRVVA
jgi:NDP-sugar pyrophosphorylase family protein